MSWVSDVTDALVSTIESALGTDYTVEGNFTAINAIQKEKYPFAMVWGPSVVTERLTLQQSQETLTLAVQLFRKPNLELQIRDDVEAVIAELAADTRIEEDIRDAWFSEWGVDPTDEAFTVGILTFTCFRVTD